MYDHLHKPFIETYGKPFTNYAQILEQVAAEQMSEVLRHDWVVKGALMPDAHCGFTLPIGGVVACNNMISPAFVGVDIGCGVCAQLTSFNPDILRTWKKAIRKAIVNTIPVGFNHNKDDQVWKEYEYIDKTAWCDRFFHIEEGFKQLGTLGGGNHFIELGVNELDDVWIVIHSGSRGVGNNLAKHYMSIARPDNKPKEGVYGLPFDSAEGQAYYRDMNFMLEFALENRRQMIARIIDVLKTFDNNVKPLDLFINRTHNHAEVSGDFIIHRKGATHAEKDMMGVVPGHMTHGSYIVVGKGNPDSLCSSSHGAGRILGRKAAERELDLDIMKLQIEEAGVEASADCLKSLQEAPDAYKSPEDVMLLQQDLIDIVYHIKPLVNVKG